MLQLPIDYLNKIASQTQFISALLCGFSLTVLIILLDKKESSRIVTMIIRFSILATGAFLVSIFAMTNLLMMTTEGYPFTIIDSDIRTPRLLGLMSLMLGVISLNVIIAMLGWTKSKSLGIFSTIIGIITFVLTMMMMSG